MPSSFFSYQRLGYQHAALLLALLFAALYPFFQYMFDVDAVGYISVTRHYAAGEWMDAINGYWSPLNSWLMVPFAKIGLPVVTCFKVANLFFGIGILYQTEQLLSHFSFAPKQKIGILITATIIVLYFAYFEIASDILFVWLFFIYTNWVLKRPLDTSLKANLGAGIIAAFVFFSKTYGFVFFIIHFSFLHLIWFPFIQKKGMHVKNYIAGILSFFLLVAPWVYLLWHKYHMLTFGYAGKLNLSWILVGGHPDFTSYFYDPAYKSATSIWVDPLYGQKEIYTPLQSKALILRECKVILYNIKIMFRDALGISFLWPVLLVGIWFKRKTNTTFYQLGWLMLLFPLVYLLVVMEERYMWPIWIPLLVAAAYLVSIFNKGKKYVWWLVFFSFCIGPVVKMIGQVGKDKAASGLANYIKTNNIQGPFTGVDVDEETHKAAFLTGNQYYALAHGYGSFEQLETQSRLKGIKVICVAYKNQDSVKAFTNTAFFKLHQPEVVQVDGMKMWLVKLR